MSVVRRPLAAGPAAALLLVLAVGGCGGDGDESSPPPAPSTSATGATPTSTATSATPTPTPAPEGPQPVDAARFGELVDAALDDTLGARLVVENGLGFLSGEGEVDFRQRPSSLAMTLISEETGDDQAIRVRIVDEVMYLQDAAGFLRIDLDSPANPFGSSLADQLDPRTVLEVVEQALASATSRGTVAESGETLDVYQAVADGPTVVERLAPDLADQPDVVVPPSVTCDLTIDADGHARTISVDLGPDNGRLVYTLDEWSTGVSVEAPPADQVEELPDLPG